MLWYNPTKRKPILQLRILRALALHGELTRKQSEDYFEEQAKISRQKSRPHYNEISDAYCALSKKGLIKEQNSSLAQGRPYCLTEKGLDVLINEAESEHECWSIVIDYSISMRKKIDCTSYSQFNGIFGQIAKKFSPYKSIGAYAYILQIFNVMSRRLIEELGDDNTVRDLLLAFTLKRVVSVSEIGSKIQMDNSRIKKNLEMLSFDTISYTTHYTLTGEDEIDPETDRWRYIDFLQHCIIFYHDKDGNRYYELSLFGILFLIKLLIAQSVNSRWNNRILLEKLDGIAVLYHNKLPLIFGKWAWMKTKLNFLCTRVFEPVLTNREETLFNKEQLVSIGYTVMGDDKPLFRDVYPMYVANNIELQRIIDTGLGYIYKNTENNLSKYQLSVQKDIAEINSVLDGWKRYLHFRRRFLNIEASIDDIFESIRIEEKIRQPNSGFDVFYHNLGYPVPLSLLEKALEDEVTLIYYLNLMDMSFNPYSYSAIDYQKDGTNMNKNDIAPIERLRIILKDDDEIRHYLNRFMNDATDYHNKEISNIKDSSNSFQLQIGERS